MSDIDLKTQLKEAQHQLNACQARITQLEALYLHQSSPLDNQQQHYSIFDNLLEGCQMVSFDWRYLYLNNTAIRHSQRSKSDLLGYTMMECYPGIEKTDIFAVLQRCMQEHSPGHIDDQFIYPDGTAGWFSVSVEPIPEGIFILSLDITERKQAEASLKRYTQRMEILHEIDIGIINASSIQDIVATSLKHLRQLIPCQRASVGMIDNTTGEWLSFAVSVDRSTTVGTGTRIPFDPAWLKPFEVDPVRVVNDMRVEQNLNPRQQLMVKEGIISALHILLTAQGQNIGSLNLSADTPDFFIAEYQEIAIEIANQLAIAIHQLNLVEALKHHTQTVEDTRSFLQTTLDAFPANTAVLDPDGTIITFNLLWKRFADENNAHSHYPGANYLFICDTSAGSMSEEAASAAAGIRAVIAGEQDEFNLEYPCNSPTEERWFMLRVTPFAEAAPRRVVVAHINITERRQAEKSLNRSLQHLEILHKIDTGIIEARTIKSIVTSALQHIKQLIPCYRAGVFMFDPEKNNMLVFAAEIDGPSAIVIGTRSQIPDAAWLTSFGPDRAKIIPALADAPDLPIIYKQLLKEGMQSSLHVLLMAEGQTIGLLNLLSHIPHFFTAEHQHMVVQIGNQLAIAIHQMRLKEQMEQHVLHLRQAEKELGLSEARYRSIIEDQAELICRYDADFRLKFVNTAYANIYGISSEDMIGRIFLDNIPPMDRDLAIRNIKSLTASHPLSISEHQSLMPDGSIRWFQWADRALLNDVEEIVEYQGVGRDITEQKQAQSELEALYEATSSLFSADNLMDLGQQIVETVVQVFEQVDCGLILIDSVEKKINRLIRMGSYSVHPDLTLDLDGLGLVPLAIRTGEIVYAADVTETPNYLPSEIKTRSELVIPLKTAKGVIGVLDLQHVVRDAFGERDKRILAAYAERAASAIENMQLYEEINYRAAELEQRVEQRTEDLNIAKERVETILHNSLDAIVLLGFDFSIQQVNVAFNRLFACEPDEYFNRMLLDLIAAADVDRVSAAIQTGISERQGIHIEAHAQRKNGSVFDIEMSIGYFRGTKDQGTEGFVCTLRDITQRKEQERQLRYHASLQQNVSDAVIVTNMAFQIQSWNRAAERTYGWPLEDVVGQSVAKILQTEFLSDGERERSIQQLHEQGWWQGEVIQHHKDGSIRHVLGSVTLVKDEIGVPFSIVSVNHDITDRKRAEENLRESQERFSLLVNSVRDYAIYLLDTQGNVTSWNQGAQRIKGYTADEILGQNFERFYLPEAILQGRPQELLNLASREGRAVDEGWRVRKDGTQLWAEVVITSLRDRENQLIGYAKVTRDLTERKRAEEALHAILEEEHKFQHFLKALHEITIELTQIDELDAFYKRAVELGLERFGFERLGLLLYDAETQFALGTYGTDAQGNLIPEHHIRFDPSSSTGILSRTLKHEERFFFDEHAELYSESELIGWGWNAVSALWNGTENLGWLAADNGVHHAPISQPLLDILSLYALTLSTLLVQKRGELALRESEERFRQIAENIDQILFIRSGDDQKMLYINPRYEGLWGKPRTGLYENPNSYLDSIHPDDLDHTIQEFRSKRYLEGGLADVEYRIMHPDQIIRWVRVRTFPIKDNQGVMVRRAGVIEDITERKQAEAALRESEEKFRLLMDAAPVSIVISDQSGHIALINNQTERIFGYNRAELVGQSVDILVPSSSHSQHASNRASYLAAPRVRQMGIGLELSARRKDGSEFPVEIELSYIETPAGLLVMSFVMDITERKRIAAELERQSSFLRSVIDVSPNMIFVKDYDSRFVLVNRGLAQLYNTTVETLIGRSDADFSSFDQEVTSYLDADRRVITSGEPLFIEEPFTNSFGETLWFQTTKVPIISADGKSKHVLGVSTDITERKHAESALRESEAKYRSLIETMRGGLAMFDLDGRITYINDRFCEILGYARDEVIGTRPSDYVDKTNLPLLASQLQRRRNAESATYEMLFRHKTGRHVYLLVSGSPLFNKSGDMSGSFAVTTDITLQKQAEDALRQALAKEKELGDLKSRFVSMASHEFRTPLATILALNETLSAYRHKLPEAQIAERFEKIKEQVSHLKDIMEDVLLLARMQARRVEFNPVILDLDNLCRSVLDEFQSRPDVTHLIEYTCDPALQRVRLDKKLMRQVLNNLITNAIKYSPPNKTIRVSLSYVSDVLTLSISDQGIGIPDVDLGYLFEPFHRAANVGAVSGTGLGLVIVKEAVELHSGTIRVESHLDMGTTFTIRIPISTEENANDDKSSGH